FTTAAEQVRNVSPIKINEFRAGTTTNATNGFVELYNAGDSAVDLSHWSLTEHPAQQPVFSTVAIPPGTRLAGHGFYLLGLANSGLAAPASAGDTTLDLSNTRGLAPGRPASSADCTTSRSRPGSTRPPTPPGPGCSTSATGPTTTCSSPSAPAAARSGSPSPPAATARSSSSAPPARSR